MSSDAARPSTFTLPGRFLAGARSAPSRVLSVLFLAALAGCAAEGRVPAPRVGMPLPAFEAATLDGRPASLADHEGKPMLVNLWATWCPPCREETPFLQSLHETWADEGLEVVGVSVDDAGSLSTLEAFLEEAGVTYTVLHDARMTSLDVFAVVGLPATLLVDRDGTIRFFRNGPVSAQDTEFMRTLRETVSAGAVAGE